MLNSNLLQSFRYLEPFLSYKQKKRTIFNSAQKVSTKLGLNLDLNSSTLEGGAVV